MDSDHDMSPTAQQARDQLTDHSTLTTPRDRRVHGLALAAFGLLVGGFIAVQPLVDDTSLQSVVMIGYVLVLLAVPVFQRRFAHTAPRHSTRLGFWALGATAVLSFVGVGWRGGRGAVAENAGYAGWSEQGWGLVITALVIALPCLVMAVVISRGRPT